MPYDNLIPTDVSISPGASGGPLVNARGERSIDIDTTIRSRTGVSVDCCFAESINITKFAMPLLAELGKVTGGGRSRP